MAQHSHQKRYVFNPLKLTVTIFIIGILVALCVIWPGIDGSSGVILTTSPGTPAVEGSLSVIVPAPTNPAANPKDTYTTVNMAREAITRGDLILINANTSYRFDEQDTFVSLYDLKSGSYKVKDKNVSLAGHIISPLNRLLDEFYSQSSLRTINIISGYRSYDYQQMLYNNSVTKHGAAEAGKWVAVAGTSEHHSGLALDLGILNNNGTSKEYDGKGTYRWINDNAFRYGFIVRYRDDKTHLTGIYNEPWHFRYVGLPHSYILEQEDLCLEEYIDYLRDFEFGKKHLSYEIGEKKYEIYFTRETNVPVPKSYPYTLSGNNVDGFIVTIELN